MARKEHHVVPNKNGGWDVKINDAGHRTYHTRKKSTAVKKARAISRRHGSELVIHNSKGRIEVKNSHPVPTKRRKRKAKRHAKRAVRKTKRTARKAKRSAKRTVRKTKRQTRRNVRKAKRTTRRNKRKVKRTVRKAKRKTRRRR